MEQRICKYLCQEEVTQGIVHEQCRNPGMLKLNNVPSDKMICIGVRCGMAVYDDKNTAADAEH
jgi:hypothetical protein